MLARRAQEKETEQTASEEHQCRKSGQSSAGVDESYVPMKPQSPSVAKSRPGPDALLA